MDICMFEFKPRVLLRSKHRVKKNADFSRTRHNVQISSTYPRHSSTNWNQISRQFSLRINHLLLEKGFYPEQLLLFCVVLLKWAFCSTFCVFWSHFRMLAVSFEIFCHRYLLQSKDGKNICYDQVSWISEQVFELTRSWRRPGSTVCTW